MAIKILSADNLSLHQAPDGALRAQVEGELCTLHTEILRAFPLSHEEEYLVLRDGGGRHLGVVERLADLPSREQELLRQALQNRYFLPRITAILSVQERFGSSIWQVETDRGPVTINTRAMNEAVSEIGPNRYLLRDTDENRYEIADLAALDAASRARFMGKV